MRGNAPLSQHTGVPGWISVEEEEELYARAKEITQGSILEIGGEFGRSASIFAAATPAEVKIFSVDIRFDGELGTIHKANLDESGLSGRVTQIPGDSKELATSTKFRNRKLDLLFVDGDHSEKGAYTDLDLWTGKIKKGGYLLVHDCAVPTNRSPHASHYEVMNAVSRFMKETVEFELLKTVDSLMVFKRV